MDVHPYQKGKSRGPERIVIGNDGSIWFTEDHYQTFNRIRYHMIRKLADEVFTKIEETYGVVFPLEFKKVYRDLEQLPNGWHNWADFSRENNNTGNRINRLDADFILV